MYAYVLDIINVNYVMRQTHLCSFSFNHDATGVNCLIHVLHVIDYLELSDLVLKCNVPVVSNRCTRN